MPTMDDRIYNWLDSGRLRWPALAALMSLISLSLLGFLGAFAAMITTILFDGHAFTSGQKVWLACGWAVAFVSIPVVEWLRDRLSARRAAAEYAATTRPQEASASRCLRRRWLHAATGIIWLAAVVAVATIMTLSTLSPLVILGLIEGYSAFSNTQLLLIGVGWVCVWGGAFAAFSRWGRLGTARRPTTPPADDTPEGTVN